MTGSKTQRGFTLLIAVLLASVAVAVGLALSSIAYKSVRLSDVSQGSQYAFYAADTALECALYADQKNQAFDYANAVPTPSVTCVTSSGVETLDFGTRYKTLSDGTHVFTTHSSNAGFFDVDGGRCAHLNVYKGSTGSTTIYAEGVTLCNVADPRTIERGIYAKY